MFVRHDRLVPHGFREPHVRHIVQVPADRRLDQPALVWYGRTSSIRFEEHPNPWDARRPSASSSLQHGERYSAISLLNLGARRGHVQAARSRPGRRGRPATDACSHGGRGRGQPHDLAHRLRMALGDPPEHEERRPHLEGSEQFQDLRHRDLRRVPALRQHAGSMFVRRDDRDPDFSASGRTRTTGHRPRPGPVAQVVCGSVRARCSSPGGEAAVSVQDTAGMVCWLRPLDFGQAATLVRSSTRTRTNPRGRVRVVVRARGSLSTSSRTRTASRRSPDTRTIARLVQQENKLQDLVVEAGTPAGVAAQQVDVVIARRRRELSGDATGWNRNAFAPEIRSRSTKYH